MSREADATSSAKAPRKLTGLGGLGHSTPSIGSNPNAKTLPDIGPPLLDAPQNPEGNRRHTS
eukprot:4548713-Pyramimonas_sp.AAC.1